MASFLLPLSLLYHLLAKVLASTQLAGDGMEVGGRQDLWEGLQLLSFIFGIDNL